MLTTAWSSMAATVTPAPMSNEYLPSWDCSRRSSTPNCAWRLASRWPGWWFGQRNLLRLVFDPVYTAAQHLERSSTNGPKFVGQS